MKLKTMLSVGYWGYKHKIPFVSGIMNKLIRKKYSCDIPTCMPIPKTVSFKHNALGVTINAGTIIEDDVVIHQNVTIGKMVDGGGCPVIKKGVLIGAGAIVLGDITIGENAKIGAGAIVVDDVPAFSTVVCKKAEIIKKITI